MTTAHPGREFHLGAVILAAGRSARMGRPKLLLPWGETTVLGHLLEQWRGLAAEQIAVVCVAGDQALLKELERLSLPAIDRIHNPAPERGMYSSIQCAAQWPGWKPSLTHWAIILGDQPHLRPETLQQVIAFAAAQPALVCQPSRGGRRRHPVLLPKTVFARLASASAGNLKEFLFEFDAAVCELEDPGLDLDLDRPEDYERALRMAKGAGGPGER
jgi:molybdenum cofactor cytidylyltransferase